MILIGETANCLLCHSVHRCVLKVANFRYYGNMGLSEANLTSMVQLADPENHTIQPRMTSLSYMQPKLWQICCENFEIFVTMATGVGVIQILFAQLNSPTLKTLCFMQELGTYLLYKQSYSKFSVKIQ